MQEKIEKTRETLAKKIDFPIEVMMNVPKITIIGKNEITIENHSGIILFEREIIKVKTKLSPITINGEDFEILYIGEFTITISGKFKGIFFEV